MRERFGVGTCGMAALLKSGTTAADYGTGTPAAVKVYAGNGFRSPPER